MTGACTTCGGKLGRGNRSGYCKSHVNSSPEARARNSEAQRRAIALNPALREARRRAARKAADMPGQREIRSERAKAQGLSAIGTAARTPETYARMGRATSEYRMAWCPPELRDEARHLTKYKRMKLTEVKVIILAQHESNLRRYIKSIGGNPDVTTEDTGAPAIDPALSAFDRALIAAASKLDVDIEDVRSSTRLRPAVHARWAVMATLRDGGLSFPKIGKLFGLDHTSVQHGVRSAVKLAGVNPDFAEAIELARAA